MLSIIMLLQSAQGDELGRLMLSDVKIAAAGNPNASVRPDLSGQMAHLLSQLTTALAREGLEPAQSATLLKVTLARGIVSPPAPDGTVMIALPVRAVGIGQNAPAVQTEVPARRARPAAASTHPLVGMPTKATPAHLTATPARLDESEDWGDLFKIDADNQKVDVDNQEDAFPPLISARQSAGSELPPISHAAPRERDSIDDFDEDY